MAILFAVHQLHVLLFYVAAHVPVIFKFSSGNTSMATRFSCEPTRTSAYSEGTCRLSQPGAITDLLAILQAQQTYVSACAASYNTQFCKIS